MRILWINNIAIPKIAKAVGMASVPVGGWMVKLADELVKKENIDLGIAFPYKENVSGHAGNIQYFAKLFGRNTAAQARKLQNVIAYFLHAF